MDKILPPKTQAELAIQHRQRFSFNSSMGEVILKRITYLDYEQILSECADDDPEFAIALEKIAEFNSIAADQRRLREAWEKEGSKGTPPIDFPEEFKAERAWARMKVSKFNWRAYGPCFVKPVITSKEDLDIFMQNLQPHERESIVEMLIALIAPIIDLDKNLIMLAIAYKYGIKWSDDLFLTNMTLNQAQILLQTEQKNVDQSEEVIKSLPTIRG